MHEVYAVNGYCTARRVSGGQILLTVPSEACDEYRVPPMEIYLTRKDIQDLANWSDGLEGPII